ncbi:MAG: ABC-2 family transporter protein [Candidatus Woesebacteria bacterium]|jgi:ABC-2 type transport system permease protein
MKKYFQVFRISFQQELAYRASFVLWRIRNVFQIFLVFFLWDTIFLNSDRVVFGYDRTRMLTYVFGLMFVRAFVLSSKSADVAGEVSRGDISNHLIKPISYFKYWLTRDISSKALNIGFALVETAILFVLLNPPFFLQSNPLTLAAFIVSLAIAMFLYFIILFLNGAVPFWFPEMAWGMHFVVAVVVVEFLSGALFPIDILPQTAQRVINLTPFPYLIFFPLQVYLGNIEGIELLRGIAVSVFWVVALWFSLDKVWQRGLRVYQAHGR